MRPRNLKISLDCRPNTWGYLFSEEILFTELRARVRKEDTLHQERKKKEREGILALYKHRTMFSTLLTMGASSSSLGTMT